jgi:pimeloyl-ACP methyl ester carboxylesterase
VLGVNVQSPGHHRTSQGRSTSRARRIALREAIDDIDVSAILPRVRAPTLILHSRDEAVAPLDEARHLAARLPDARFVLLDSQNHLVLPHEPAWQRAVDEITAFLAPPA